jgi:hypothetical protein
MTNGSDAVLSILIGTNLSLRRIVRIISIWVFTFSNKSATIVAFSVSIAESADAEVALAVAGFAEGVAVALAVAGFAEGVAVALAEGVAVALAVAGFAVALAEGVAVALAVAGFAVALAEGVAVALAEGVAVALAEGVAVALAVAGFTEGVVAEGITASFALSEVDGELIFISFVALPDASISKPSKRILLR